MWTPRNLRLPTLTTRPVDGDGGVLGSPSHPVVHNQLLSFAEVELEVVVLAPRCQGSHLLSVRRLVAVGDQADDGRVVSNLDDGVGAVCGHAVMCEQREEERAEHTALGCAGVQSSGIRTAWGLPVRKLRIQSQREVLSPRSMSVTASLEGTLGLNVEL